MLCKDLDWSRVYYPCYVQPKLNGVNARLWQGRLWTRDGKLFPRCVSDIVLRGFEEWPADVCLQGELYRHGWPLQRINGAIAQGRATACEDTYSILFWPFDIVDTTCTFEERFCKGTYLPVVPQSVHTFIVNNKRELELAYYETTVHASMEGLIIRIPPCHYLLGKRSWDLMRWKPVKRMTVDIVSWAPGKVNTKYVNVLGCLIGMCAEGTIVNISSGISDKQRDRWCVPGQLPKRAIIEYECLSEAGVPLKPRLVEILA